MSELLDGLYAGETRVVVARADGTFSGEPPQDVVALAGSFNPLHDGHRDLLAAAERVTGRHGIFELSIENVDKPDLPRADLEKRLAQFRGVADIAITRARLFADKAAVLPGAWFVLGFDTAVRLLDDRYYPDDGKGSGNSTRAVQALAASGTRFVVAGRVDGEGRFREASELEVPEQLKEMFVFIPSAVFRSDISSTELRQRRNGQ